MPLFIANTTRQHHTIQVRVPESNRVLLIHVRSGSQWESGTNLSEAQRSAIVEHLERFGGRSLQSIRGQKVKGFSGYVYSDKKISIDSIFSGHEIVVDEAQDRSVQAATASALANDIIINDSSTGGKKRLAKVTGIEVVEEPAKGQRPTGKEINMSLEVTPQGRDDSKIAV